MAGQIEYLKIVGMLIENPHIRSKKDGYFSKENCTKQLNQSLKKVQFLKSIYTVNVYTFLLKNSNVYIITTVCACKLLQKFNFSFQNGGTLISNNAARHILRTQSCKSPMPASSENG